MFFLICWQGLQDHVQLFWCPMCVALEKLEWTRVWDTSYSITAVRILYSLWLHSRTSWNQWKDSNGTPAEWISCAQMLDGGTSEVGEESCFCSNSCFWVSFLISHSHQYSLNKVGFPTLKCKWFLCNPEISQLESICMPLKCILWVCKFKRISFYYCNSVTILWCLLFWSYFRPLKPVSLSNCCDNGGT